MTGMGGYKISKELTKDNYDDWSSEVTTVLVEKNLWYVIHGDKNVTHDDWKMNDRKVLHMIQSSCGQEASSKITQAPTARIAWETLASLYSKQSTPYMKEDVVYAFFKHIDDVDVEEDMLDVTWKLVYQINELPLPHQSTELGFLYALANMPCAFPSGNQYGFLQQLCYKILRLERTEAMKLPSAFRRNPTQEQEQGGLLIKVQLLFQKHVLLKFSGINKTYKKKMRHHLVLEILKWLGGRLSKYNESELRAVYEAILQASKHGIIEFISEMHYVDPCLVFFAHDKDGRGIFSHASLNHRKEVFKFIDHLSGRKDLIKSSVDEFGDTLLHLAAYVGPTSDYLSRSGALLQMQREIQWFEMVKGYVNPSCEETKNKEGKTPREIFTESHKDMVKAGEKWTKETASSFTLVGILITTIMLAAAFTVPGGNNLETGTPTFLNNPIFSLFIVADAISLLTSVTSVILFIGLLTSHYAEKDFFKRLPLKLLCAVITLFFSVVSMMVAFCAALALMLKEYHGIITAVISLATIPIIVLVTAQLRLIIEILKSTMRSN